MINPDSRYNELAPCGVFCGACPSFKRTCKGCASEDKEQNRCSKWSCKIRICCYDQKGLNYCINCAQFPCKIMNKKLFSTHQDDPMYAYRFEIPVVFAKLKSMSIEEYFNFQTQRWKCSSCGGTIQFYYYTCVKCGNKQIIKST